jgi:hypothetical protein
MTIGKGDNAANALMSIMSLDNIVQAANAIAAKACLEERYHFRTALPRLDFVKIFIDRIAE